MWRWLLDHLPGPLGGDDRTPGDGARPRGGVPTTRDHPRAADRDTPRPVGDLGSGPGADRGAGARRGAWAGLPALAPVTTTARPSVSGIGRFADGVVDQHRPRMSLAPLGHDVSPTAPTGVVTGITRRHDSARHTTAPTTPATTAADVGAPEMPLAHPGDAREAGPDDPQGTLARPDGIPMPRPRTPVPAAATPAPTTSPTRPARRPGDLPLRRVAAVSRDPGGTAHHRDPTDRDEAAGDREGTGAANPGSAATGDGPRREADVDDHAEQAGDTATEDREADASRPTVAHRTLTDTWSQAPGDHVSAPDTTDGHHSPGSLPLAGATPDEPETPAGRTGLGAPLRSLPDSARPLGHGPPVTGHGRSQAIRSGLRRWRDGAATQQPDPGGKPPAGREPGSSSRGPRITGPVVARSLPATVATPTAHDGATAPLVGDSQPLAATTPRSAGKDTTTTTAAEQAPDPRAVPLRWTDPTPPGDSPRSGTRSGSSATTATRDEGPASTTRPADTTAAAGAATTVATSFPARQVARSPATVPGGRRFTASGTSSDDASQGTDAPADAAADPRGDPGATPPTRSTTDTAMSVRRVPAVPVAAGHDADGPGADADLPLARTVAPGHGDGPDTSPAHDVTVARAAPASDRPGDRPTTVRRAPTASAPTTPSRPPSTTPPDRTEDAGGDALDGEQLNDLFHRLYPRVRDELRWDLRVQRERAGMLTDPL